MDIQLNDTIQLNNPVQYIIESSPGTEVYINGSRYLYFAGTGYYQLQTHPEVIKAAIDSITQYGISSATSRSISGTTDTLIKLEEAIANFYGTEDAAYVPSGYLTNMAGLQALSKLNRIDKVFMDEDSHYCLTEAVELIGKPIFYFKNRNVDNLSEMIESQLKKNEKPLIVSDGMFPVWAKLAPVEQYLKIAEKYDGLLWIDDAHPAGILGKMGRGTYEYFGVNSPRQFMGATLAKAFGAYGGIIPGSYTLINEIRNGTILKGSSAPMSAAIAASKKGIQIVKNNPDLKTKLHENARYLKAGLESIGIPVEKNEIPVATFVLSNSDHMEKVRDFMMQKGIFIQYIKYKGAGKDGVLRIVVTSSHNKNQIDFLVNSLKLYI